MKKRNAYLFLDWYMTTNELVLNGKINKEPFHLFVAALNNLKELGFEIKLLFLSGTSKNSAIKTFSILNNAFKEKQNLMLKGFAFEYGGFLILKNGTIKRYYNKTTLLGDKINQICKKYGFSRCEDYELYYNFKFNKADKQTIKFVDICKNEFGNKDFEFYNDKYGAGLDVKNKDLNKSQFVSKYLKNKNCNILVFGGDSVQDEIMFEKCDFQNKFFLGFKEFANAKAHYVLSSKNNIWGIIEDINNLTTHLKTTKEN